MSSWESIRAKNANIGKRGKAKGKVKVTLTNNLLFALSMRAAAFLYEERGHEEHDAVKAFHETLPDRESLYNPSESPWRYIESKSRKIPFDVEHLPTLLFVLKLVKDGAWSQQGATERRIKDIEALPALTLLACASGNKHDPES